MCTADRPAIRGGLEDDTVDRLGHVEAGLVGRGAGVLQNHLVERALRQNSTDRVIRLTDGWLDALAPKLKILETTGGT